MICPHCQADLLEWLRTEAAKLPESTIEGYKKAYVLLLKGMESQAELMHDMKQELRSLRTEVEMWKSEFVRVGSQ